MGTAGRRRRVPRIHAQATSTRALFSCTAPSRPTLSALFKAPYLPSRAPAATLLCAAGHPELAAGLLAGSPAWSPARGSRRHHQLLHRAGHPPPPVASFCAAGLGHCWNAAAPCGWARRHHWPQILAASLRPHPWWACLHDPLALLSSFYSSPEPLDARSAADLDAWSSCAHVHGSGLNQTRGWRRTFCIKSLENHVIFVLSYVSCTFYGKPPN
jgi:hypothetical protein